MTTCALGILSLLVFLLSADRFVIYASSVSSEAIQQRQKLVESMKEFFLTSVVKYFGISALLLAMSNIFMASMSLITETYFGLIPTYLWIGALGFPIGGMVSITWKGMSRKDMRDSKTRVLIGCCQLLAVFVACIGMAPLFPPTNDRVAKAVLFGFAFVVGMIYSLTYTSSLELWLLRLKDFGINFVSRATVINKLGNQVVIAIAFQAQTALIDRVSSIDEDGAASWAESLVYFGPHMLLLCIIVTLCRSVPYPRSKDSPWPKPLYSWGQICLVSTLNILPGLSKIASDLVFVGFQLSRMALMMEDREDINMAQGPSIPASSNLNIGGLEAHLEQFGSLNSTWWKSLDVAFEDVLLDNSVALSKRLQLIANAKSSIAVITWAFEDSDAGQQIAEALIQRAYDGLDVKVIVDGVNLAYLNEEQTLLGTTKMEVLKRMSASKVQIRSLQTWVEDEESCYVVGSHRKIMIIDDSYLLTGGRNIHDAYLTSPGRDTNETTFHFRDADVVLKGDFSSTSIFFHNLWKRSEVGKHLTPIEESSKDCKIAPCIDELGNSNTTVDLEAGTIDIVDTLDEPIGDCKSQFSVIHLNHEAGMVQGSKGCDIVLATLLYAIEAAQDRIDLAFGYFQLFSSLEDALARARKRGVEIRLLTNSESTNDLPTFTQVFGHALRRLLEMGVKLYAPQDDKGAYCLHYKMAAVDGKFCLVGSWNCMGTSVFFDAEYSIAMFDNSDHDTASKPSNELFASIEELFLESRSEEISSIPDGAYEISPLYKCLSPKYGKLLMERGY